MVEKKYTIVFSKRAEKDKKLIKAAGYEKKVREILQKLMIDPYYNPLDVLQGNLKGFYSKRMFNIGLFMRYWKRKKLSE